MTDWWHVIDRYVYHTGWAIVLVGLFFAGLYWLVRRYSTVGRFISDDPLHLLVTSGFIVTTCMPLREAYDVMFHNQPNFKTPFDQASWILGAPLGIWLFYRLFQIVRRIQWRRD